MSKPQLEVLAGFPVGQPTAGHVYGYYDNDAHAGGWTYTGAGSAIEYAPDFIPNNISAYARNQGFTLTRGVQQIVTTSLGAAAGTFETTLGNTDRRFDPNYSSGPYVGLSGTTVRPGIRIKVTLIWQSVRYPLFVGTIDDWPQTYVQKGVDQTVPLKATDDTQVFADGQVIQPRPNEYAGARITAIANEVQYKGPRHISHGTTVVGPLTQTKNSAWPHVTEVVDAEWGDVYFANDGTLTFRDRDAIQGDTRTTTSQATFGDAPGELPFSDLTFGSPPIVNDCTIVFSELGGKVNAQNIASQNQPWGKRSETLSLYMNPITAKDYAQWIIDRYAYPITTFASVQFMPGRDASGALWVQALTRELGDRITVNLTPDVGGRISNECIIRGIQHQYANESWTTTFTLQDVDTALSSRLGFYTAPGDTTGTTYTATPAFVYSF